MLPQAGILVERAAQRVTSHQYSITRLEVRKLYSVFEVFSLGNHLPTVRL
jgi:hypothetical protein